MTSLIGWTGVDQRGNSSVYFASDSRLTWPGGGNWDYGRKLFLSRRLPQLLAYCGDVLFPTQAISQIVEMIDLGGWDDIRDDVGGCVARITSILEGSLATYPTAVTQRFDIVYAMRVEEGLASKFHVAVLSLTNSRTVESRTVAIPARSGVFVVLGSGATEVTAHLRKWSSSDVGGTSRAVFSAFADALKAGRDLSTGGPPQLVGLYRKGGGRNFGIVWEGKRYFYGTPVERPDAMCNIDWRNDLFEVCDPATLARREGAQPQPRPNL